MKRLFALLLALTAVAVLCACGTEGGPVNTDDTTDGCTDTTEPATEPVTEPPAPKEKVIYVDGTNGNDENDALTPETAVATYEKAFSLLAEDRNRIVITNTVRPALDYSLPEYDGLVVFTSVFDGVDYMEQNGASLRVGYTFSFNCDVLFENIHIRSTGNVGNLCFNFHNVTVGDNVNVTNSASRKVVLVAGYNVSDVALNADGHMTAKQVSHKGDCTVTVNSGSWHAIIGGNFREGYNSPMGTFDGNLTVNIGGTAEVTSKAKADDIEGLGVAAAGHNISKGTVTLNISGGTFDCPVYAIGKVGRYYNFTSSNGKTGTDGTQFGKDVRYEANVTVNVSGGTFTADAATKIAALQVPGDTALHGDYTLNVTGGTFKDGFVFSGFGVLGNTSANGVDAAKAQCFDSVNGTATAEAEPLRIACCGDSITFGTCAAEAVKGGYTYAKENYFYPTAMQKLYGTEAVVGNFGYPGSNISTSYNRYLNSCVYASLVEFDPDIIVLALGTNNAALMPNGKNQMIINYRNMLKDMNKRFPDAKIIMTTALYRWDNPDRTKQVDQFIIPIQKQMADEFDFVYLYDAFMEYKPYGTATYYKDKLHPNNTGYQKLAEVMKKGVDQLLKDLEVKD